MTEKDITACLIQNNCAGKHLTHIPPSIANMHGKKSVCSFCGAGELKMYIVIDLEEHPNIIKKGSKVLPKRVDDPIIKIGLGKQKYAKHEKDNTKSKRSFMTIDLVLDGDLTLYDIDESGTPGKTVMRKHENTLDHIMHKLKESMIEQFDEKWMNDFLEIDDDFAFDWDKDLQISTKHTTIKCFECGEDECASLIETKDYDWDDAASYLCCRDEDQEYGDCCMACQQSWVDGAVP